MEPGQHRGTIASASTMKPGTSVSSAAPQLIGRDQTLGSDEHAFGRACERVIPER